MAVVKIEVASEFLQTYDSGKALRESNHPKRMGGAVINCAALLDDSGLFNIPRRRNHPTIVFARTWYGYHPKWKRFAQIIHSLIVAERTNSPIERGEVLQDLHH